MRKITWLICLFVLALAFLTACGDTASTTTLPASESNQGSGVQATPEAQPQEEPSPQPQETPSPQHDEPISFGDTFKFNGSSGQIELTFGTSLYWGTVENTWSEHYGETVFAIPVTIQNISSETGGLNLFDFTIFGSDGLRLDSIGSSLDYDIAWESNMRAGASQTGLFYFLFNGDGEYVIEFSAGFGFGDSQYVIFEVSHAEEPSLSAFDISTFPPSTFTPLPVGSALTLGDSFEFSGSSGEVEISFGTNISWTTVDNTWSQHHGAIVFSVPISVTNIGTETGGLNLFDFSLFGADGLQLSSVSSMDGDIAWEGNMRPDATQEGYLHFLYVGDGQYAIEFAAGLGFGDSQEVMFDITR